MKHFISTLVLFALLMVGCSESQPAPETVVEVTAPTAIDVAAEKVKEPMIDEPAPCNDIKDTIKTTITLLKDICEDSENVKYDFSYNDDAQAYRCDVLHSGSGIEHMFTSLAAGENTYLSQWEKIRSLTIKICKAQIKFVKDCGDTVSHVIVNVVNPLNTDKIIFSVRDGDVLLDVFADISQQSSSVTNSTAEQQDEITTGMRNAIRKGIEYLKYMPFSHSGLIKQLEYEGFSKAEATYGAANCGADWNEQAAKKAANYLSVMSFSKSKLIEQLEYDGFTRSQAEYGVSQNGY